VLLVEFAADGLGEATTTGGAVAQAVKLPEQVAGGGERRQAPQQGDDRR